MIHYRINPHNPNPASQSPLTASQVIQAITTAAQAWMQADPAVQLVYDGSTTASPGNFNDVIGFGPLSNASANTDLGPSTSSSRYTGFDITLNETVAFTWEQCSPPATPCGNDPNQEADLQGSMTHEWGHVAGLGHVYDSATDGNLTMYPTPRRDADTLGLGDVLGERHLYPTSAPMPTLYDP